MTFWDDLQMKKGDSNNQAAPKPVEVQPPKAVAPIESPAPIAAQPISPISTSAPVKSIPPGPRKLNAEGMALVEQFEGIFLKAYQDSVGVWTIGWGRILYDDGSRVKMGDNCTREQADQWLQEDLEKDGGQYVRHHLGNDLTDNQYAALTSFAYNRGAGRLSQLLAMGSIFAQPENMLHFDWAGSPDNHLLGLQRRRRAEVALFKSEPWRNFINWRP